MPTRKFFRRSIGTSLSLDLWTRESKFVSTDNTGPIRHVVQLGLRGIRITAIHISCGREVSIKCPESSDEGTSGDVHISNHVQRKAMLHDYQREEHKVGCELHEVYSL